MKKLVLVDGRNMAYRSFYAFEGLTTSTGKPTAVTYGSALALNRLLAEQQPDYMVVVDDSQGETFRHKLFPDYKGNRIGTVAEGFHAQLPDFYRLVGAYGLMLVRVHAVEADDIIGSLATQFASEEVEILIVSNDKDFMQLVATNVRILRPLRGGGFEIVANSGVMEKFGVHPRQVVDALALIGDTSDNIPGVAGIGDKGAAKLLKSFGSLDNIYRNLNFMPPKQAQKLMLGKSSAYLSQKLATIDLDLNIECTLADFAVQPQVALERPALLDLFRELEFKSFFEPTDAPVTS